MRITFQLRFHTQYGQSLLLSGNHEIFGNEIIEKAIPLEFLNEEFWRITFVMPQGTLPHASISYHYILRERDGTLVHDWGQDRAVNLAELAADEVLVIDSWNAPGYPENAFYTEPFRKVLLSGNHAEVLSAFPGKVTHTFKIRAPLLLKTQTLCLLGSGPALGEWDTDRPVLLNRTGGKDFLWGELDLSQERFPLSYKYGVYDVETRSFIRYEDGANRTLYDSVRPGTQTLVNDGFAVLPAAIWKGAGVAIPVFSLRSEASFGVGEFTDLKRVADWCQQAGLSLIQVLPINDTTATHTWQDSYPYSAISAFGLHPLYLNLSKVANAANQDRVKDLEPERKRLNALPALEYEAVMAVKMGILKQIYAVQKEQTFKSQTYKAFFERNKDWLIPFAAFCYLRDKYGTVDFNQWPKLRRYQADEVAALAAKDSSAYDELAFNFFLQYHLHAQLQEATEYAHAKGVVLKGDLAIGVSRHSADTWQQPELFNLHMQAGAPPDPFSAKGQNWSFPTYNWLGMKRDGFSWWKRRFGQLAEYFDAFRIDHILGFFRIWSIPTHAVEGILGHFVPAIPVHLGELASRGISFDRARYLNPFITEAVLLRFFGKEAEAVKRQFLAADSSGIFELKPEFATQRQVRDYFASLETTERNQKLELGLFDLISNVLLLETEDRRPNQFHFRFDIESTLSFEYLDPHTQAGLRDLYIDYFYRRQDGFWRKEALDKLPALKRVTDMLVCGEDLGMVPACVPEVMGQLGLLGLEVQRMPKRLNQEFSRPNDAPYLSVVTPSTHDMSTIRGWWKEDRKVTQKFYEEELGQPGEPPDSCEPWINKAIVLQHLASPAMWAIFQLQDLLGIDQDLRRDNPEEERINVPANPKNYWRYRMHLTLEQLIQAGRFNQELKTCIRQDGR
jgi:4-alpha-glucanotransferase